LTVKATLDGVFRPDTFMLKISTRHAANAVRASPYTSDRRCRVDPTTPRSKSTESWNLIDESAHGLCFDRTELN